MMLYKDYLNESFNNKFLRDIILNNEYLKYIPANTYKPTDIVEIIRTIQHMMYMKIILYITKLRRLIMIYIQHILSY